MKKSWVAPFCLIYSQTCISNHPDMQNSLTYTQKIRENFVESFQRIFPLNFFNKNYIAGKKLTIEPDFALYSHARNGFPTKFCMRNDVLSGKTSSRKSDEISVKRRIFFSDENFPRRTIFPDD